MSIINKIQGMLIGLHTGDSLGSTLEFSKPSSRDQFHTEMIGGGVFDWAPGEPTDDTVMMCEHLSSLVEKKRFDLEDIAQRYLAWSKTGPKDIGSTISNALNRLNSGRPPTESGLTSHNSQGNGSLMRCAPLVLLDPSTSEIEMQCGITHRHKNCFDSDVIFLRVLKNALQGQSKNDILIDAIEFSRSRNELIYNKLASIESIQWDGIDSTGYVIDTLVFSIWAFFHYSSFEESLVHIVNRGGDADTLGAVTGAICGAYYGVDDIPKRWLEKLQLRDNIVGLLNRLDQAFFPIFAKSP
jgi:ADP-ribosyl-[dinitrogen reductase] hydrolase